MAERYFDVHFQHSVVFFNKMPFRPRVVLSRLFVCKIQPEACGSVCECSRKAGRQLARQMVIQSFLVSCL